MTIKISGDNSTSSPAIQGSDSDSGLRVDGNNIDNVIDGQQTARGLTVPVSKFLDLLKVLAKFDAPAVSAITITLALFLGKQRTGWCGQNMSMQK